MKETAISACYVSPSLSTEQFVPNHCFMYLISGSMLVYDGSREYSLQPGDYGIARRNHLAKYTKQPDDGVFKKIYILFEQEFLKEFNNTYKFKVENKKTANGIVPLHKNSLVNYFIQSLTPYFNEKGTIDEQFLNVKRTELLLILLKANPELANIFF